METRAHQELRSREKLNWTAVWQTALCVGGITFIMSGGSPWSTAGTMNAIVGRDVPWNFWFVLIGHMSLSWVYSAVLGAVIFRLPLMMAIVTGAVVGLGLAAASHTIFTAMGWVMQSPETRAVLTHLTFGLFGAAVYKGASVPPPGADDGD